MDKIKAKEIELTIYTVAEYATFLASVASALGMVIPVITNIFRPLNSDEGDRMVLSGVSMIVSVLAVAACNHNCTKISHELNEM